MEESVERQKESVPGSKRYRIIKYSLAAVALLVCTGFIAGILYSVIDYYTNPKSSDEIDGQRTTFSPTSAFTQEASTGTSVIVNTGSDLLEFVPQADGDALLVEFFQAANSDQELNAALKSFTHVVEGDVTLMWHDPISQTEIPIMANPPATTSDYTLDQWLTSVIPSDKAIMIDLKLEDAVPFALEMLRDRASEFRQPVWLSAEVLRGPNSANKPINATVFIHHVNSLFPNVTVSLGWDSHYIVSGDNLFSWESMDEMQRIARYLPQRVTFLARSLLVRDSWDKFLWLLEQSNGYSLTLNDENQYQVNTEDIVFVRDNFDVSRVYYDISNTTMASLCTALAQGTYPKIFYSGGNVLDYFRIENHEAIKVTWAHRVVSKDDLNVSLSDDNILMLETDVRLHGEGTPQLNETLPIMSHDPGPPALNYELTLEQWLEKVVASNKTKGIKLDFKSIGALEASLNVISKFKTSLRMPVWLNSDVHRGPNSLTRPVNATMFFKLIQDSFPDVTLSPGWTTTYNPIGQNDIYTYEMVEEMYQSCAGLRQAITFPVRASLAKPSIEQFKWLLSKSNRYTLTVWYSTSETVATSDLLEFYNSFPLNKVYFDIPEDVMQDLMNAINAQNFNQFHSNLH